jgi:ankyrin repeat protein
MMMMMMMFMMLLLNNRRVCLPVQSTYRLLLEGSSVLDCGPDGASPLHLAAAHGHHAIIGGQMTL